MFSKLFQPLRRAASAIQSEPPAKKTSNEPAAHPTDGPVADYSHIAVIAGRHCLAYQGTACTTCIEHCPVSGAIVIEQGLPRIVPAICTGCRLCVEACPAPEQAILIVPRPVGLPPPTKTIIQALKSSLPALPPHAPSDHG